MRILLLNQCFHPDYVATALYTRDLALELRRKGHEVTVVTSNRGYDRHELKFPLREQWMGVNIKRVWTPGLGKKNMWSRLVDTLTFWVNAVLTLIFSSKQDVIVSLTSPPLISVLGAAFAKLHRCKSVVWLMDLNPDQAIIKGVLRRGSVAERILSSLMNSSLKTADRVVVLDRFMQNHLLKKGVEESKMRIIPPWSLDHKTLRDDQGCLDFRKANGLSDKFVVMYAGNHSPCHPLDTVLRAALMLKEQRHIHFLFVGSGSEQRKAQQFAVENQLINIACLPYQSPEKAASWLPAAELQLVVMGNDYVGIVHPCKIYNILSFGVPFLFVGPQQSHVGDIANTANEPEYTNICSHGDSEGVARVILNLAKIQSLPHSEKLMQLASSYSCSQLCPKMADAIVDL